MAWEKKKAEYDADPDFETVLIEEEEREIWVPDNLTLEEKKVDKLYEVLEHLNEESDNECIAALKWAIFELESKYCKER